MKLIIDNSLTPIELARLKYRKLYEDQISFKSNLSEKIYITSILKNYLDSIKQFFLFKIK